MELFAVNRYVDPELAVAAPNEDENLQKLLKRVEKRKRKHSETKRQEAEAKTTEEPLLPAEINANADALDLDDNPLALNDVEPQLEAATPAAADAEGGFEILGDDVDRQKRQKIHAVLPTWLAHPHLFATTVAQPEQAAEEALTQYDYLAPQTRGALKEMGITRLFPVQSAVIPHILESHRKPAPFRPRDVCVSSPTGSGKTLAFAIPVVQLLAQRTVRRIRALVILPVAELALQVFRVFKKLCEKTDLTVCLLSNQNSLQAEKEKLVEFYKGQWHSKVDIVVTTPGRLVDHLHATEGFCVKNLQFLVIDEADRIMDAVFQNWLYHLHEHVRTASDQLLSGSAAPLCYNELQKAFGRQPHKLLFSATLSQDPEKLQNLRLFQPILFTSTLRSLDKLIEDAEKTDTQLTEDRGEFIGKYTTPAELTEKFCVTESRLKPLTLFSLIKENNWSKFLCFTNSVESSGRLCFVLKKLFGKAMVIEELSASLNAKDRSQILSSFVRGTINGVVCSDALARGIDVPNVDIVISYDPPRHIKTYIHRVGRTARAGRPGTAITLLTPKEQPGFDKLLAEVGKAITQEITASTEEAYAKHYQSALLALRQKISADKRMKLLQKERAKDNVMLLNKDPASMTLMEKLQFEAAREVHKATEQVKKTNFLGGKKNKGNKAKKPKKEKAK